MVHRHKLSENSLTLENKLARRHCLADSFRDPEKAETIYLGTPEETIQFVLSKTKGIREGEIPDTPRGLVVTAASYDAFMVTPA